VSGRWHTSSRPLGPRGWIDGPALEVELETPMAQSMVGSFVVVPDGIEGELVKQVSWVRTDGTKAKLSGTWTRDGEPVNGYAGATGERIAWRAAAIVNAPSIWDLVVRLLVSTGAGVNGAHDVLPGYLGLGIPAQYVDATKPAEYWESEVSGDLSGAELEQELAASGYLLTFARGRFACGAVGIPEAVAAQATISAGDLVGGEEVTVEHNHAAPVSAVELSWRGGTSRVAIGHASPWAPGETRKHSFATRVRPPDSSLLGLHVLLARWASFAGVRVSARVLPGAAPAVGAVIQATIPLAATGGSYGNTLCGVVVESGLDGTLTFEAALKPAERFLCSGLEVTAVNHSTKEVAVRGGALEWLRWPADTAYDAVAAWSGETAPVSVGTVVVNSDTSVTVGSTSGLSAGMAIVPSSWSTVGSGLKAVGTWASNTNWRRS